MRVLLAVLFTVVFVTTATAAKDPLLCIKHHESDCCGGWKANTGNGYYGGLQMDRGFMATYGSEFVKRWGYAHNWPAWAQLTAARRAVKTRGYAPWPVTRRMCGV